MNPILVLHFVQILALNAFLSFVFFFPKQPFIIFLLTGNLYTTVFVLANLGIVIAVIG
jgi:hypothetical protein